jgi:rod shape-determining protein MreD
MFGTNLGQFVPGLTLLLVVAWSVFLRWQVSLTVAFFCGLTYDFISSPQLYPLGLNALLYSLVAVIISYFATNEESLLRRGSNILRAVPLMLVAGVGYRVLLLLIGQILRYNSFQAQVVLQVILPAAVIDAAIMFLLFIPLRFISRLGAERQPL